MSNIYTRRRTSEFDASKISEYRLASPKVNRNPTSIAVVSLLYQDARMTSHAIVSQADEKRHSAASCRGSFFLGWQL